MYVFNETKAIEEYYFFQIYCNVIVYQLKPYNHKGILNNFRLSALHHRALYAFMRAMPSALSTVCTFVIPVSSYHAFRALSVSTR